MFSVSQTAPAAEGSWTPVPPGKYDVLILEAGWTKARTGAQQFFFKGQVSKEGGGSLTFSEWLVVTKASGEPNGYGRERVAAMARECRAVTGNDQPDPRAMVGNTVTMVLGVEEDGRGVERNKVVKVIEGETPPNDDGYPERRGSGPSPAGMGNEPPPRDDDDFDSDVPFATCELVVKRRPLLASIRCVPW